MSKIQPEKTQAEFMPLTVPHLQAAKAESTQPVEPIAWFQELAPRLSVLSDGPAPAVPQAPPAETDERVPRRATFLPVEEIAYVERQRAAYVPEPPEITRLRIEVAQESQAVLSQAREQARLLEQQAREEGYHAGYEKGFGEGHAEATQQVTRRADEERAACREDLATFVTQIEAERVRLWDSLEPQIIGLVFDLAKQVIKQEIEVSHGVALSTVRNALRRAADTSSLRIRVHAEDLETVRGNREELLHLVDGIRHIEIVEDRRVDSGGAVVETDSGTIDVRIGSQLSEVTKLLEQMVAHRET